MADGTSPHDSRDEVPDGPAEGTVPTLADSSTESPTSSDRLMERICDPLNFEIAMARVIANGGSPGVDGMTVKKLEENFERHGQRIYHELLSGTYRPQPVKRGGRKRRAEKGGRGPKKGTGPFLFGTGTATG